MLILSRRIDEKLIIGDEITVAILGVSGNQVRIGVDAPKNIQVHREEIYQKVQAEKGRGVPNDSSVGTRETLKKVVEMSQNLTQPKKTVIKVKRKFDASTQTFPSDSNRFSKPLA